MIASSQQTPNNRDHDNHQHCDNRPSSDAVNSDHGYLVLIVIKDSWWSDQQRFRRLAEAQRHRKDVAEHWDTSDTAILAPDGRVLLFLESLKFRQKLAELRA